LQRDKRDVETKAAHVNFTKEAGDWTFKVGDAYDTYTRHINITDNSAALVTAWNAAVPAGTVGKFLKAMTTPLYRDGVSGAGFNEFVTPDFSKVAPAIGYDTLIKGQTNVDLSGSYNGAGASNISETINSAYMEGLNKSVIFGVPVKSNFGIRWQTTDQVITSPSNINSQIVMVTTEHHYHDMLPSFNAVANVTDKLNLRFAMSKTMTRANPSLMSSQLSYTDPSAQNASQGNPGLKPYYSNNLDFGGEYYTGKTGYIGLTIYSKDITNFTVSRNIPETFAQLGIPFSSLGITQQTSLAGYAGHTVAEVTANPALVAGDPINLSTTINLPDKTKLTGEEFMWVQPLDNLVDGLGYTVNYTRFGKSSLTNIPDATYNLTAYYEHGGFSTHLSYVYVGTMLTGFLPSANNIPYNSYNEDRHQIDLSAAYKFRMFGFDQSLTLDATNLDNQGFRNYAQFKNITNQYNNPGQTVIVGWRASY
ncbi:MAG: TonB-dependent receptor, partial [Asticcacaulis sp.]